MKKHIGIMLLLWTLFLGWCTSKPANQEVIQSTTTPQQQTVTIFALWDSITAWYQLPLEQSWPAQLDALLKNAGYQNYKVVNAGKSWDTSQQLKDRLEWSVSDAKAWDIAIVTIWGNDGFQSVPVSTLQNNLVEIVQALQQKWVRVVLWGMQITSNLWQTYISEFRKIYPLVANKTKATLIPFILEWVAVKPQYNLADMIHPNEAWYAIMAKTVFDHLEQKDLIQK